MINEYFILLIVVTLALLMPLLLQRTNIPAVVGEIVAGMAVGLLFFIIYQVTGEAYIGEYPSVDFLAHIGFIFLMFLSGLELDFVRIGSQGRKKQTRGLLFFVMTLAIAYLLVLLLNRLSSAGLEAAFFAIVLATTSLAVVLTVVREMMLNRRPLGQELIVNAVIADVAAMVLLTVYAITVDLSNSDDLLYPLMAVSIFIAILVFFIVVYRIGNWAMWYFPGTLRRFFSSKDPHELGVRASLVVIFGFVAISSLVDSKALTVLGAFLAGAAISMLFRDSLLLGEKLNGIGYGFFIPIFFITIGINFAFADVLRPEILVLLPALVIITAVAKVLPFVLLSPRHRIRTNLSQGVLMTGGLTLMIAGAEIGRDLSVLDEGEYGLLILLAVVLAVITPILFRYLFRSFELDDGGESA